MKRILLVAPVLFFVAAAQISLPPYRGVLGRTPSFTYYVDSAAANDSGNGLTPATAKKTIAAINALSLTAGQSVGFARGGTWRETLTPGQSGSAEWPITYGAYGTGAKPIISGADIESGWTLEGVDGKLLADASTVALWDFGGNLNDTSTHARTLTAGNTASYVAGNWDQAFAAGKYGTYSDTQSGDANAFDFGAGSFTVEAWVKLAATGGSYGVVFAKGVPGVARYEMVISRNAASSYIQCYVYDFTNLITVTYSPGSAAIFDGNWHHLAMRADKANQVDGNLTLWVDGISRGTPQSLAAFLGADNTYAFTVGAESNAGSPTQWAVDQVRVSSIARTSFPTTPAVVFNAYYQSLAAQPFVVLENGARYAAASTKAALTAGAAWWDATNSRVYVRTSGDDAPSGYTMEASVRMDGISDNGAARNYIVVSGLDIRDTNARGIYATGTNWIIQGNTISRLGGGGVGGGQGVFVAGANTLVRANTISNIYRDGVAVASAGALVSNNSISGCWDGKPYPGGTGYGVNLVSSSAAILRGNLLTGNFEGVGINGGSDTLIESNLVVASLVNNIDDFGGSTGHPTLIRHNTIIVRPIYTSGHGVATQTSGGNATWRDNLIVSDYSGTQLNVNLEYIGSAAYPAIDIDYSLLWLYPGATAAIGATPNAASQYYTFANWQAALTGTSYSGKDAHSINADPLFTDFATGDFTLQAGSPAIGAASDGGNIGAK